MDATFEIVRDQKIAYAAYFNSIRERLPLPLRYISEKINFGDYQLEELDADLAASIVSLRIMGETITYLSQEKTFHLRFSGVSRFVVTNPLQQDPTSFPASVLEVEIHEVEVIESDSFELRFLFHGRTEIAIRFKEFAYEVVPGNDADKISAISVGVTEQVDSILGDARSGKLDAQSLEELMAQCAVGNSHVHYRLGVLASEGGYYSLAVEQFTLAAKGVPDHTPTRFALAKAKFAIQEYADALSLIQNILTEIPNHPGALLYYVRILAATEQWEFLTCICTQDVLAVSGEVRLWYALALAELGQGDEARAVYESISKSIRNRNAALNKRVLSMLP